MRKITLVTSFAVAVAGAIIFTNAIGAKTGQFDRGQVQEIQKIVHDYLVKQPEVLIEVQNAYRTKQESKLAQKAKAAISINAKKIFENKISPSYGNHEGAVTIVEFLDYQCAHCRDMATIIQDVLKDNDNVHFVVKELPIFGASSNFAARAAVASSFQDENKFRTFHLKILNHKKPLTNDNVLEMAKDSDLDVAKLKVDMEKDEVKNHIKDNFKLAQEIGLQGTPAFIIGTKDGAKAVYIAGATSKEKILEAIKQVGGGQAPKKSSPITNKS